MCSLRYGEIDVTPFTGVWIEMIFASNSIHATTVTPFTGVWIEIKSKEFRITCRMVTPFTGVWIEISRQKGHGESCSKSLPSRECGLKSANRILILKIQLVTPFTGVWIEIYV